MQLKLYLKVYVPSPFLDIVYFLPSSHTRSHTEEYYLLTKCTSIHYLKSNQRFFKQPQQGSGKRQLLRHDGALNKTYGSNNVSAKESIGLLVAKDFDHTVGLADSLCAAVGDEGELADVVFDALYKKTKVNCESGIEFDRG
jgi:hypothetical protein